MLCELKPLARGNKENHQPIRFTHTMLYIFCTQPTTPAIVNIYFTMWKIICLLRTSLSISCVRPSVCPSARPPFRFGLTNFTTTPCISYLLPCKIYFTDLFCEIVLQHFYLHHLRCYAVDFPASVKLSQLKPIHAKIKCETKTHSCINFACNLSIRFGCAQIFTIITMWEYLTNRKRRRRNTKHKENDEQHLNAENNGKWI